MDWKPSTQWFFDVFWSCDNPRGGLSQDSETALRPLPQGGARCMLSFVKWVLALKETDCLNEGPDRTLDRSRPSCEFELYRSKRYLSFYIISQGLKSFWLLGGGALGIGSSQKHRNQDPFLKDFEIWPKREKQKPSWNEQEHWRIIHFASWLNLTIV